MRKAFICGLAHTVLTSEEALFLAQERPAGLIIFSRNVATPQQLARLIDDARNAIDADDVLVLVDQEGGRVQRLAPPHWHKLPSAQSFAERMVHEPDAGTAARASARDIARLTAHELRAVGINVNCVPCADVPTPNAHDIIGARAYGSTLDSIVPLARVVAEAHMDMSVLPVLKHIPGHGRALVDSHLALPVVAAQFNELAATDFAAFRALNDLPAGMTAHVVYSAIDAVQPATTSSKVISEIIRGEIGFDGLLMSDDLSMHALQGGIGERAVAAVSAGCDLALHCNGRLTEMAAVASNVPAMTERVQERFAQCIAITASEVFPLDLVEAEQVLAAHMQSMAD